ncbi:DUF3617 domain-containing protein [Allosphingosinicella deserti]|uniref:DUF3617 domain-containing protein n=1 Tax=Allosphingosinicella deserti TaxID=2116704 RepID=A0A2P7QSL3_9SPHN|nr:DUF3617 family protein [Sphingomonas deserti]PSJ40951.1 hypothetical protein C7I55_11870 [Sphingomonas deserti]
MLQSNTRLALMATVITALSLPLAGCGRPDHADNGAAPTVTAEAKAGEKVSALPQLRPGLWRSTSSTDEPGEEPETVCIGAEDNLLEQFGALDAKSCSKFDLRRSGNSIAIDAVCSSEHANATLQGTYSGDFSTHMTADLKLGLGVPGQKIENTDIKIESRYVGTCIPEPADVG